MPTTIATLPGCTYPTSQDDFSPGEAYPEYAMEDTSASGNDAYALVRRVFQSHGLDKGRFGSADWNPLGAFVSQGSRIFVLCNFVYHRRPGESAETFEAKCVHASVLRALIDYLLIAAGPSGRITFGNSALQSCDFPRVLADTGADRVEAFYRERGLPVRSRDLRLYVTERDALGRVHSVERRNDEDVVEIDLGADSLLAGIPASDDLGRSTFRISDYDPSRTQAFHAEGRHRYLIHRDVLDADVVVSLSKLKTHEKVGLTCGLKGFVGTVGHKDCLAHHRFGNPGDGGDEYPDRFAFLKPVSRLHDWVNRRSQDAPLQQLAQIVDRNLRRFARKGGAITTGAWHGNDTCWRMTLDLARIVHFATASGEMTEHPQRRHLSLIDGIVAGENEGPLSPSPVRPGALVFGDDVALADRVACRLMGFDPNAIPLVREAFAPSRWPVTTQSPDAPSGCIIDDEPCLETELPLVIGRSFQPASGWRDRLTPKR